jgi:hypothetical protein
MPSETRIDANRRNAQRSTGPRTDAGKKRSSANAVKHGLGTSITRDPLLHASAEELATLIAGEHASYPSILELAYAIAEAEMEMRRARSARYHIMTQATRMLALSEEANGGADDSAAMTAGARLLQVETSLERIDRFERRALSRRQSAVRRFTEAVIARGGEVPFDSPGASSIDPLYNNHE